LLKKKKNVVSLSTLQTLAPRRSIKKKKKPTLEVLRPQVFIKVNKLEVVKKKKLVSVSLPLKHWALSTPSTCQVEEILACDGQIKPVNFGLGRGDYSIGYRSAKSCCMSLVIH
jgi:hypothetical protein